ncbi:MAG: SDR family oxidoreductase [Asgard group archaeon]|nr:SDR family oxidoreductase [Asgard group archaeon]
MNKILVTGSSRGLGLEFVKQFLERGNTVIATCRNPDKAVFLKEFQTKFPSSLTIIQLDVTDEGLRNKAFEQIKRDFDNLNILINNAGIISGDGKNLYHFGDVYKEDFMKVLQINSLAPLLMSEKFFPLLENGSNSKIINISSLNGCITKRAAKGKYSYCTSKAALNMISKILSNDLLEKEIAVIALHPGWIKTDMGGPNAPMELVESISLIIDFIERIDISDTGKFLDWKGNELPW